MPGAGGMLTSSRTNAGKPPADTPMPTIGKGALSCRDEPVDSA
jgi:hypothetical protein